MSEQTKPSGVIGIVLGLLLGGWAFARIVSIEGQFHTWSPPFSGYEIKTFAIAGFAAALIVNGIIRIQKAK
jgi:hypothetical protein